MDAKEVKSIRQKMGLTQEEFSLIIGVSYYSVVSWENGRRIPSGPAVKLMERLRGKNEFW
ncbi:TPA: helix-turn-helix domain-containing protein [Candidatus Poribacteria bacterium]|nr:helix-turn-helix domain-containing protein [Flavobacteriales bacterium]HIA65816.1 helix-turn-helix domain-containing protein [Candidatus Poribacteria bacterium]